LESLTLKSDSFHTVREAHTATVKLFKEVQAGKYEAFTSAYVIDELLDAGEPKRSNMLALITEYNIKVINYSDDTQDLADIYVKEGVIPA